MNENQEVIVGIDVGIASVGWCITKKSDMTIIKHGSYLFPTVDDPKNSKLLNVTRREKRSLRRQFSREKTRKRDFIKFLIDHKYITDIVFDREGKFVDEFRKKYLIPNDQKLNKENNSDLPTIYYLRQKALQEKISQKDLWTLLYWYLSHRGFKYEVTDKDEQKKIVEIEQNLASSDIKINIENILATQIAYFQKYQKINGNLNRVFKNEWWAKEIEQILEKQAVDQTLCRQFLYDENSFFKRQRSFAVGPGNEKTPTDYGLYARNEKGEIYKKYKNIFEKTIGRCSVYHEEKRAPKNSLSAEIFNLLNDCNNLTIKIAGNNKKLSITDKWEIIKISCEKKANLKSIQKYITNKYKQDEINDNNIEGFRVKGEKKTPIITELTSFHLCKKLIADLSWENIIVNVSYQKEDWQYNEQNIVNKIINIFQEHKDIETRHKEIKDKLNFDISFEDLKKHYASFSGTHAFSYKALHEFIPQLLTKFHNQMKIIHNNPEKYSLQKEISSNQKHLDKEWIEELIASPTVKRSFRQTINVVNSILDYLKKEDLILSKIVVETTRETNNESQRKTITRINDFFNKNNETIKEIKESYQARSKGLDLKLFLYIQQDGKDAYDSQVIQIDDLVRNPRLYEVDHIIPYTWCYDDSRQNKVLTKASHNANKGQTSAAIYIKKQFGEKKFLALKTQWKAWYFPKDKQFLRAGKKFSNLIDETDYANSENRCGFINRNLRDTSYIARSILNYFTAFFKPKNIQVVNINGKMTGYARKLISYEPQTFADGLVIERKTSFEQNEKGKFTMKDRTWNGHHAEDAYLITILSKHFKTQKTIEKYNTKVSRVANSKELNHEGKQNKLAFFKNAIKSAQNELESKAQQIVFNRAQLKKTNIQLFNETLYEGRLDDKTNQIIKIEKLNLLELDQKKASKYFGSMAKDRAKILLYKNNKNLYDCLNEIYQNYSENKYPFAEYIKHNKMERLWVKYQNKTQIIEQIRVEKEAKEQAEIIFADSQNNGLAFFESFNWVRIDLYRNKQNKYKIIPINASNATFNKGQILLGHTNLNKHNLIKQKENKKINLKTKPLVSLYKNNLIMFKNNDIYYLVGHAHKQDRLELKKVSLKEKSQNFYTLNKKLAIDEKAKIIRTKDHLGINKEVIFDFEVLA